MIAVGVSVPGAVRALWHSCLAVRFTLALRTAVQFKVS
jgi:hypothetical protein